jgi:hypothetical protein
MTSFLFVSLYFSLTEVEMNRNALWLMALGGMLCLAWGCGPSAERGVIVKGKLTKGGVPLTIPGMESGNSSITVTLAPVTPDPKATSQGGQAMLDNTGGFQIVGAGKGVTPGKYRLHLQGEVAPGEDAFSGAYSGEKWLKEVEVPADKLGGELDLGTIELNDIKPMP